MFKIDEAFCRSKEHIYLPFITHVFI